MAQFSPVPGTSRFLAAWALILAIQAPALVEGRGQSGFTDEEKGPNWVPPLAQIGGWGERVGQFLEPRAVAIGPDDRIVVADSGNHRVQVFLSDGTRVEGWGKPGTEPSEFRSPSGIAVGPNKEVVVADTGNDRIQVFDSRGKFLRLWTRRGRPLRRPWRIAVSADRIALIEQDDPRVEILSLDGESRAVIGGLGDAPGRFREPSGLSFDNEGNLYVADAGNSRIQKFDAAGNPVLEWGSWGAQAGLLASPRGVSWSCGRVYVADADNHRVQVFDPSGRFLYQWGRPPLAALKGDGRLHYPSAIAVSPSGGLTVVAEIVDHRCQVFANGSVRKVKPASELPWWDDLHVRSHMLGRPVPPGTAPSIWATKNPPVVAAVLEADGHAVLLYDLAALPTAFVGRTGGYGRKLGELIEPCGLVQDGTGGRFYVSDRGNRRVQLMELVRAESSPTGFAPGAKVIAAFEPSQRVPSSVEGYRPDLGVPEALALDSKGNLLVVDGPNAAVLVFNPRFEFVRAVRIVVDSGRTPVRPAGVALRPDGKVLYVTNPPSSQVLALDWDGRVLAAWGTRGAEGASAFLAPSGIAVDGKGDVYVADSLRNAVLKFDEGGRPLAQWGTIGAQPGRYLSPRGVTCLLPNRLLLDDLGNHRAQLLNGEGKVLEVLIKGGAVAPLPNPK